MILMPKITLDKVISLLDPVYFAFFCVKNVFVLLIIFFSTFQ